MTEGHAPEYVSNKIGVRNIREIASAFKKFTGHSQGRMPPNSGSSRPRSSKSRIHEEVKEYVEFKNIL